METLTKTESKTSSKIGAKIGIAFAAGMIIAAALASLSAKEFSREQEIQEPFIIKNPENVTLQTSKGEMTIVEATGPDGEDCLVDANYLISEYEDAVEDGEVGLDRIILTRTLDYQKITLYTGNTPEDIYVCSGAGTKCKVVIADTNPDVPLPNNY